MIDKLLLNNQLVASKEKVRQAKVNVVNNLVRKIRKIKTLKEKRPEDSKLDRKIERTEEILACVKKLKSIEVLKKLLISEKNPISIITSGNSNPQEISEALLHSHKLILEIINRLKEVFHLNDSSNPDWRNQLVSSNRRKEKIPQGAQRTTKFGKSQKADKQPNEFEKPVNQWVTVKTTVKNAAQEKTSRSKKLDSDGVVSTASSNKSDWIITKEAKHKSDSNECAQSAQTLDSFFVTKTGDNYLSAVVIEQAQPEVYSDGLDRRNRRNELFGDRSKVRKIKQTFNKSKNFERGQSKNNGSMVNEEDLHPSWVAKRKQNEIQKFQGKKVKFEVNGNNNSGEQQIYDSNVSDVNKEKLHPSWEAKQRMKPAITEFKGKKIVFEDTQ